MDCDCPKCGTKCKHDKEKLSCPKCGHVVCATPEYWKKQDERSAYIKEMARVYGPKLAAKLLS